MVRQARSETTRRKIITSAVELFNEIGYLATAIIEEGSARLAEAFRSITASSAPALESIIHGVFVVADLMGVDEVARSGMQLLRACGEFNNVAARTYGGWVTEMTELTQQAIDEGDVRGDLDPRTVAET